MTIPGMGGENNLEQAQVDAMVDYAGDIESRVFKVIGGNQLHAIVSKETHGKDH